jgi:hypothetical protein
MLKLMMIKFYCDIVIILCMVHLISCNPSSLCKFTKSLNRNGVEQQLQVESWGSDSIRIRLSPDVIIQTPDYEALLPEKLYLMIIKRGQFNVNRMDLFLFKFNQLNLFHIFIQLLFILLFIVFTKYH